MSDNLQQRIEKVFVSGRTLLVGPEEVMELYLALARLRDLERFGSARDWPAIKAYCPIDLSKNFKRRPKK